MPIKITKSGGEASLWKVSSAFDKGTLLSMYGQGRLYIVIWDGEGRGRKLVRVDDNSFTAVNEVEYESHRFREVKAERKVEL